MHDGGGTFVHASFLLIGEAKDIKSFLNYMIFGINIKIISDLHKSFTYFSYQLHQILNLQIPNHEPNLKIKCHNVVGFLLFFLHSFGC